MNPAFSIIIPVYKAEKTIKRIVQQILQSYMDLELILVIDGSPDTSLKICKQLSAQDNRVRVINQKNSGPSAARNNGIINSRGKFIVFCDADDEIISENFSNVLRKFQKNPSDMTVLGWKIVQKADNKTTYSKTINLPNQSIQKPDIIHKTIKSLGEDGRMYNLWNKIYRADVIKHHNLLLRDDLGFGEDLLFNMDFLKLASKIEIKDWEPYYIYEEDSPTSIVSQTKLNQDFRNENSIALEEFSKLSKNNVSTNVMFVKWRWFISYCIAVNNSNNTFSAKHYLIKSFLKKQNLKLAYNNNLSIKQRILELLFFFMAKIPVVIPPVLSILKTARRIYRKTSNSIILLKEI